MSGDSKIRFIIIISQVVTLIFGSLVLSRYVL